MHTAVDLCNDALARIAQREIMSLDDASNEARQCRRHFANTLREVLRDGSWRCARARAVLAPLEEPPPFGWSLQFQLPGDFIRAISVNENPVGAERCPLFEVEGRRLLMNCGFRIADCGLPNQGVSPPAACVPFNPQSEKFILRLVYIRDLTQPGVPALADADALFLKAASLALAAKLAWPFQQSDRLAQSLLAQYQQALRSARTVNARDAFEKTIPAFDAPSSEFHTARF
jgi:hypothetical protein